jgi:hypothetical protein
VGGDPTPEFEIGGNLELEKWRRHSRLARDLGCEPRRRDEPAQVHPAIAPGPIARGREPLRGLLVENDGERTHRPDESAHEPGAFDVEGDGGRQVETVEPQGLQVVGEVARVHTPSKT